MPRRRRTGWIDPCGCYTYSNLSHINLQDAPLANAITFPDRSDASLGRPSRKAAEAVLEAHLAVLKGSPLKAALSEALKARTALGGQERRFVALATRELSRHQRLLDTTAKAIGQSTSTWALKEDQALIRYALWRTVVTQTPWEQLKREVKLPGPIRPRTIHDAVLEQVARDGAATSPASATESAVRHSFTRWMAERLEAAAAPGEAEQAMEALNREPGLILRSRPHGSRDQRITELAQSDIQAAPLPQAPDALTLVESGNRIFDTPLMKRGQLQVQDLGSQLIVEVCRPESDFAGATIADVCAGAGGKTLALADRVGPKGRIFALDRSARRLSEAKRRVSQAHLTQVSFDPSAPLQKADVILVDAPCSGSGNLAREPDLKWKLNAAAIADFSRRQSEILADVINRARIGAVIVYATCSLFREENEEVIASTLAQFPSLALEPVAPFVPSPELCTGAFLRVWPHRAPGGGFFAARLRKGPSASSS